MSQGQQKPKHKTIPYSPIKYLVSSVNTFFGHALVNRFRNEHIHPSNPNCILGTLSTLQPQMSTPNAIRKIIDTTKISFFQEIILNSDVIVYDLNTCDLKQAEFVISTVKMNEYKQQKILICVSNVMTWANTPPKVKKQTDEEEQDNPPQQPDSQQQNQPQDDQEKKTYVRYNDKDYHLRKSHPSYDKIKSIETLCLAAGKVKNNLKTYVVCSGILYGCGERVFAPYFLQARLQKPDALHYFGKGNNRIPLIHLEDLVTYIQNIVIKKPPLSYILAIDHNPKPTLKKIMQAISKGIGTGKIITQHPHPHINNIHILILNLRIKPTMYFAKLEEQQAAIQQQEGNCNYVTYLEIPKFKFQWKSKDGLQKSIQKLCQQYNQIRGFTQQKVFIVGPPASGKTHYAKILSQKYYLPHIHIKGVIQQIKALPAEDQFANQIRNYLNEKKQSQIQTKQTQYDQNKQKMKKIPKQFKQKLQPFDPQKVDVRLSDQLVYKCFKWRLNQNDCLNRGYILDGYPKKYEDAFQIFMDIPKLEEGEQAPQQPKKQLDQRVVPKKVIVLMITDEQILKNIQQLPEEIIVGTHFQEKQMRRRLKIYRKLMDQSTGELLLEDFFKENKINIFHVNVSSQTLSILQSIVKPLGTDQKAQQEDVKISLQELQKKRKKIRQEMDKKQQIIRNVQNQDYLMKKQNQQNQQRQILDKKSLALRKYLDVNLVPILSEGIVEILHQFPKDPVDRLAEFLFKNALKVPNPDPSSFQFLDS